MKVRALFVSFACGISIVSFAQQKKADSLKALLPGKTDLERADIFYELTYEYGEVNYTLAATYSDQSLRFAKRSGDSLRIVKAARIKASMFRRLGEMDSSVRVGLEMLPIASRNNYGDEVKKILRGLAVAYTYKANFDLGLQYNFELLHVTELDGDSIERGVTLNNIGFVYLRLSNYKKALHYFQRALDSSLPLNSASMARALLNTGACYSELKDFVKAREYLWKGFDNSQSNNEGTIAIEGLHAKGVFYFSKGDLDSAETYFLKSYALAKKVPSERYQLLLIFNLTRLCLGRNQLTQATQYLSEAESVLQKTPFEYEVIAIYSRLSDLYKKIGNPHKQVLSQEKYIQYSDSVYGRTTLNNLMKVESEFLERKSKAMLAKQEQLLTLHVEVINRQQTISILMGVIATLLILLLTVLFYRNKEKRFDCSVS